MLTQERLKEVLVYNSETGIFTWRTRVGGCTRPGKVAGSATETYVRICVDGQRYQAHRLAWLYVYGEWPVGDIDHKNTQKRLNRLDNLRPASHSQNQGNKGPTKRNTSGFKGVSWHNKDRRWCANIEHEGRGYFLGNYKTAQEAHEAYARKARELFGEFARVV